MKKTYIAPMMEEINIETIEMMAASLATSDDTIYSKDALSNSRRGTWGTDGVNDDDTVIFGMKHTEREGLPYAVAPPVLWVSVRRS